jgi:hypothetical protein
LPLNAKKLSTVIGATVAVFLLDWFYLDYITSHAFALKTREFALGTSRLSIPLQWMPIIGVVLVSLVAWYEVTSTIFPRRAGPELDPLSNLRLLRVVLISLGAFVCVLYIPYIVGSNWFWTRLSTASGISQVHDFALSLLNTDQSAMQLDPLWQYSISQASALLAMMLAACVFGRAPRRMRR